MLFSYISDLESTKKFVITIKIVTFGFLLRKKFAQYFTTWPFHCSQKCFMENWYYSYIINVHIGLFPQHKFQTQDWQCLCHTPLHPLSISLCIPHRASWCLSVLAFRTGTWHPQVLTASRTCLIVACRPLVHYSWSFSIKLCVKLFSGSLLL